MRVPARDLADEGNVHPAHESDDSRIRRHSREQSDQVGSFVLLEQYGAHVRQIDGVVDDYEFGVRIIGSDVRQRDREGEAGHDDGIVSGFRKRAHGLLALRLRLEFDIAVASARFRFPPFRADVGVFVE